MAYDSNPISWFQLRLPSGAVFDRFVPLVGTLSGNPIAATAGLATLGVLKRPGTYERFFETGERLMSALAGILAESGIEGGVSGAPPMFDIVFGTGEVRNYRDTIRDKKGLTGKLNELLHARGILKGEHKYYLSTAIGETDVEETIAAWRDAIGVLAAT